jgi:hypothetical protein
MGLVLFSYIWRGLLGALKYDQFWRNFRGLLRRIYMVWKLGEIFSRHQLGPFDIWMIYGSNFFIDFLLG